MLFVPKIASALRDHCDTFFVAAALYMTALERC